MPLISGDGSFQHPKHETPAVSSIDPGINTWYTVFEKTNVILTGLFLVNDGEGAAMDVRVTIDDVVYGTAQTAEASVWVEVNANIGLSLNTILTAYAGVTRLFLNNQSPLWARRVKVEARIPIANLGALTCGAYYSRNI